MASFQIDLSPEESAQLIERAQAAGIGPQELLQASIADWLGRYDEEFANAANHILRKNAELYRRLA